MKLSRIFAGRREADLLAFPSVYHMAEILAARCHDEIWTRNAVASLARFSTMTGLNDLETLRLDAQAQAGLAERTLATFAQMLADYAASQVAVLAMGAKLWFRLNGIAVPWSPLPGRFTADTPATHQQGVEPFILLALTGSRLYMAELQRLRIGDLGELDSAGRLIPNLKAEPLVVQYQPRRGHQDQRITFLSYQARQALLRWLLPASANQQILDPTRLLLARPDGSPLTRASLAWAGQRGRTLIQAGNNANVELCRATGDFFRSWGAPGARFTGPEELNGEEYI